MSDLNLTFADPSAVTVSGFGRSSAAIPFASPLNAADKDDIRWYLETYGTAYTTEVDDRRADAVKARLETWGEALYAAVFGQDVTAGTLVHRFLAEDGEDRVLTVSASHPAVLSLPWELLRTPEGAFLCNHNPPISVRRRLAGAGAWGGDAPPPREALHLLFVVSRPEDTGFIDPRSDPRAVMDALDSQAEGRVTVEFLRPATLVALERRLHDSGKPRVDILHFDGHGAYDPDGRLRDQADRAHIPDHLRQVAREAAAAAGNRGYLLLEEEDGTTALVDAKVIGELFHRQKIGLVVLSACQSAAVRGHEDSAMGSVAAGLVGAGIPHVLAMSHSVLVDTTRRLFGRFYAELVQGKAVGAALDGARAALFFDPHRGQRHRGEGGAETVPLILHDWFLPALYQSGQDGPLLRPARAAEDAAEPPLRHNLPHQPEWGFHGRAWELWQIERAFARGTRRLSLTGFGGQGKTRLAVEAGLWLLRTGQVQRVCFVGYDSFQGHDPVEYAVSALATVLDCSLLDAKAATAALKKTPTLLILDNLEALDDRLAPLLDAAVPWSEAGSSRVLLTSRQPDFGHDRYPTQTSREHVAIPLDGLRPEDAERWVDAVMALPPPPRFPRPDHAALEALFDKVQFHPLSIALLAQQLKQRRIADLSRRLDQLLLDQPADAKDRNVIVSLNLSLDRLDEHARIWLPALGVFQGGAFEPVLKVVIGLAEKDLAAGATAESWPQLRQALERAGLIQAEPTEAGDWLRFHPTLAPVLWAGLDPARQADLRDRHRRIYAQLARALYHLDTTNPHVARAVAWCELPNLLAAVHRALDAGDADAADFADSVNRFLGVFGLQRERAALAGRAAADGSVVGRSSLGEHLYAAGRSVEAQAVFEQLLRDLGEEPGYQRCVTWLSLARCLEAQGQLPGAERGLRQALAEAAQGEHSGDLRRLTGQIHTALGDVLAGLGDFPGARDAYAAALTAAQETGDVRGIAVANGQLGSLALQTVDLIEAERRYQEALILFRDQLHEPESEAVAWHQLGVVYQTGGQWEAAERAFRHSAHLDEQRGDLRAAAQSWNQLAVVTAAGGKAAEAEGWYRKAIAAFRAAADAVELSTVLNNLADLLANSTDPAGLAEARRLAEESLALKQGFDPAAAEIWKTYGLLADIAARQAEQAPAEAQRQAAAAEAARYRRLSRDAAWAFAGIRQQVKPFAPLIAAVMAALGDPRRRPALDQALDAAAGSEGAALAAALRRLLDGERAADRLCEPLDYLHGAVIMTILHGLADPATLGDLVGPTDRMKRIAAVIIAWLRDDAARQQIGDLPAQLRQGGFTALADVVVRLGAGERDPQSLAAGLDAEDQAILALVLAELG